ncbi:MAG: SixA phosphatase family protein [Ferrimicrobium sp.]
MKIVLIRHAQAGKRELDPLLDRERRLIPTGIEIAETISRVLDHLVAPTIYSSPFPRCLETVTPLAIRYRTNVTPDARLAETASRIELRQLAQELLVSVTDAVCCSHGNIVPDLAEELLDAQHVHITDTDTLSKGAFLILEFNAATHPPTLSAITQSRPPEYLPLVLFG